MDIYGCILLGGLKIGYHAQNSNKDVFDFDDTSFSLSQLLGVSIEELLDVFETLGFF